MENDIGAVRKELLDLAVEVRGLEERLKPIEKLDLPATMPTVIQNGTEALRVTRRLERGMWIVMGVLVALRFRDDIVSILTSILEASVP